ncbi:ATP-binding protein [Thermophilibacter sp.]
MSPQHQKPFIGRAAELSVLEEEWRRGNAFVVLYGRRRVGKTALIKRFIQDKDALYFLASKESEELNLQRLAHDAAAFTGNELLAHAHVDDWRTLFKAIADARAGRHYVLVIDEFPYLISANRAMPSIMQYVWDEVLAGTGVTLILCGSSVSMMRDEVLSHESPLYGRRTSQMRLKPLSFAEVEAAFPEASFESLMDVYTVAGGVPKYLEFFSPGEDIGESLRRNVLSTTGFLYEEPEFLLSEETRGTSTNLSLLRAVAQGNRKVSEMANFLRRRTSDLTSYLSALTSLGFLERRTPFNEKYPERSKNGLYHVSDEFMLFWLTYVQPFQGELEMGNMRPSLEAMDRTFRSSLVAREFERISAQTLALLCAAGDIDFVPSRIGGYWDRSGRVELDVCAVDNVGGRNFLGECKYYERRPVGEAELENLLNKAKAVPNPFDAQPLLGLFSHTGFTVKAVGRAADLGNVVLIDKNRVMSA